VMSDDPITKIIRFASHRVGLHVLNLVIIFIITGCGGSSNVQIGANFPTLITKPLDIKAAVVLDPTFVSYIATPNKSITIDIGSGQKQVWENSFLGLVRDVSFIDSAELIDKSYDLIVVPSVVDVQVSVPSENYLSIYEVWIKYNIDIRSSDGANLDNWYMPVYGKTSNASWSRDRSISSATETALRDVGAKLSLDFFRIPSVRRYINNLNAGEGR
jgi:hypothetical protein